MVMVVTGVVNDHLTADPAGDAASGHNLGTGYVFHRETGMEVDEVYGWGPNNGVTGSRIVPESIDHAKNEARRTAKAKEEAEARAADAKAAPKAPAPNASHGAAHATSHSR
jgi:hypothetical protein